MKKRIEDYTTFGITERGDAALDLNWMKYKGPKILITKDPNKLLNSVREKDLDGCIIHTTITGLGGTALEPNVPHFSTEIKAYNELVRMLGINRVILRVDPIFVGSNYEGHQINIFNYLIEGGRCRTSFMDLYAHVLDRFVGNTIGIPECYYDRQNRTVNKHADLNSRIRALEKIKMIAPNVEICGEPDLQCFGCVSKADYDALNLEYKYKRKIGFQRIECECIGQKKELLENKSRCGYNCLYCYWIDHNTN